MGRKPKQIHDPETYLFEKGGLIQCAELCKSNKIDCPCKNCKYWIKFKPDLNCTLIAAQSHGSMSLRDIGKRLGLSHVAIQQIEEKALSQARKMIFKAEMKKQRGYN